MSIKKRLTVLALSVSMLAAPVASLAEGAMGFSAGDLTRTAISESYAGGMQLNLRANFGLEMETEMDFDRARALA